MLTSSRRYSRKCRTPAGLAADDPTVIASGVDAHLPGNGRSVGFRARLVIEGLLQP
jgi:hypothetical protein